MFRSIWESIIRNKKGVLLMLVSSVCVCIGQLLWKLSAMYGVIVMLLGFLFYGVGALVMIYAYRFGKLSVLQPVLSMNYALCVVLATVFLHERITVINIAGVVLISFGVIFIAGGDSE